MSRTTGKFRLVSVLRSRGAVAANSIVAASVLALAGCQSDANGRHGVDSRQFQDVVVPAGFRLSDRAHESYSREDASARQGHFLYTGTMRIDDAAAYVLQRMPQHSWRLVDQTKAEEEMRLRFERGVYAADYLFRREDGSTQMIVDYSTDYSRR